VSGSRGLGPSPDPRGLGDGLGLCPDPNGLGMGLRSDPKELGFVSISAPKVVEGMGMWPHPR